MRRLVVLLVVCGCNTPVPKQEPAPAPSSVAPAPSAGSSTSEPPVVTLPGAGLPGGVRAEPRSGRATLADIGLAVEGPDTLEPRWLGTDALVVTLAGAPVMIAKTPLRTPDLAEGVATTVPVGDREVVMCERTLRDTTYHLEATATPALAEALAAFCKALR